MTAELNSANVVWVKITDLGGDAPAYVTAARGAISPSRFWMTFGVAVVRRFHAALPLDVQGATALTYGSHLEVDEAHETADEGLFKDVKIARATTSQGLLDRHLRGGPGP